MFSLAARTRAESVTQNGAGPWASGEVRGASAVKPVADSVFDPSPDLTGSLRRGTRFAAFYGAGS